MKHLIKYFSRRLTQSKSIVRALIRINTNNNFRKIFFLVKRGDLVYDFGANVGDASLVMWLRGARVIAFEPHPGAFKELKKRTSDLGNITLINAAIFNSIQKMPLYMHESLTSVDEDFNSISYSQASSLRVDKENVSDKYILADTLTIKEVIRRFGTPDFIKCDIEGGEYDIYIDLIDCCKHPSLRHCVLECHATKNNSWIEDHSKMLNSIKAHNVSQKFLLNWH